MLSLVAITAAFLLPITPRCGSIQMMADEGLPRDGGAFRKSGDDGIAKTAAVEQLGAQLRAQSAVRQRQRNAAFAGTVELHSRPGCAKGESVRKALAGLGISSERLTECVCDGEPEVYVDGERIGSFWMEIGSGKLAARLQGS